MNKLMVALCVGVAALCAQADDLRIPRRKALTANVGVVSVGLDTYWKQCPGLIDDMVKKHKINRNRVYLSGFSMGGMMTYAAMNKIADKIAAFAPVSGYNMGGPNPKSSRPVPILHVHGTGDDVCVYSPVMSHVEAWARYDKCNMTAVVQKPKSGPSNTTAELIRYRGGQNGVEVAHLKLPGKGQQLAVMGTVNPALAKKK